MYYIKTETGIHEVDVEQMVPNPRGRDARIEEILTHEQFNWVKSYNHAAAVKKFEARTKSEDKEGC